MLHIFICPKCFNFRIVSRKPDAVCFHCGARLFRSDIDYIEYIDMSEQEREKYKEDFVSRMKSYQHRTDSALNEQNMMK